MVARSGRSKLRLQVRCSAELGAGILNEPLAPRQRKATGKVPPRSNFLPASGLGLLQHGGHCLADNIGLDNTVAA
jgi:hypothetical protein